MVSTKHYILLDEGSNIHCANQALINPETVKHVPPKYSATIGGFVRTDKVGTMQHTNLQCDYTPQSPFNIISKELIKRDPAWCLSEDIELGHRQKCYVLTRIDGYTLRFVPINGVYVHIIEPTPIQSSCPNTVAASVHLPRQYMDTIAQLTFSSTEKHGLLRIYPLLESGLSYNEITSLIRTKHITNLNLNDVSNAKAALT